MKRCYIHFQLELQIARDMLGYSLDSVDVRLAFETADNDIPPNIFPTLSYMGALHALCLDSVWLKPASFSPWPTTTYICIMYTSYI